MALSQKFLIFKVFFILFVAHFTMSKVSVVSSTSIYLFGSFDERKVETSANDREKVAAALSMRAGQQTTFAHIVALADSSEQKVRRTHNLYRLIGQVCFALQRFSNKLGRIIGLKRNNLLLELTEEEVSTLLRSRGPEYSKGNRRFLGNIFQTKQFPKSQKSLFKAQIRSLSSIFTKISLVLSHLILTYLTVSYLILSFLTLSYLTLSYLTLPYLILPDLTLSYLTLPYLTLSYLILSYLILSCLLSSYLFLSYLICCS